MYAYASVHAKLAFRMALHLCVLASLRLHLFVYIYLLAHIVTP